MALLNLVFDGYILFRKIRFYGNENKFLELHWAIIMLETFSAVTSLMGALLLAIKSPLSHWTWPLWMLGNISWVVVGIQNQMWGLVAQNIGFSITSGIGMWVWFAKPIYDGNRKKQLESSGFSNPGEKSACNWGS